MEAKQANLNISVPTNLGLGQSITDKQAALVLLNHLLNDLKTPSSTDNEQGLFKALAEQLALNSQLSKASQETLKLIIEASVNQFSSLEQLKDEIQNLENELKGKLTADQAQKLESELSSLQSQYNAAMSQISRLQQEESKTTDPQTKAKIEEEIAAEEKKVSSLSQQVKALAAAYPQVGGSLQALAHMMQKGRSINPALDKLCGENGTLNHLVKETQSLENQLNELSLELQNIAQAAQDATLKLQAIIKEIDPSKSDAAKIEEELKVLSELLQAANTIEAKHKQHEVQVKEVSQEQLQKNNKRVLQRRGIPV